METIPTDAAKALSDFAQYAEYLSRAKTDGYKELADRIQLDKRVSTSGQLLERHAAVVERAKEQVKRAAGTGVIGDSTTEPSAVTASTSNEIARPPEASANSGTIPTPVPAPAPSRLDASYLARALAEWGDRDDESISESEFAKSYLAKNPAAGTDTVLRPASEPAKADAPPPADTNPNPDSVLKGESDENQASEENHETVAAVAVDSSATLEKIDDTQGLAAPAPAIMDDEGRAKLLAWLCCYRESVRRELDNLHRGIESEASSWKEHAERFSRDNPLPGGDKWKAKCEKAEQELAGIESEMEPYCGDEPKPSLAARIKAMHRGYDDAVEELAGSKTALNQAMRELAAANNEVWSCIHNHTRGLMALSHRVDAIEQSITLNRKQ